MLLAPSDSELVVSFLEALGTTGCSFALLDGSEGALHPTSDLDLVSSAPLPNLLTALSQALVARDVFPVMHVQYDIGRGDALWLVGRNDDVLQVDILSDRRGVNRLAFPTDLALRSTHTPPDGFPRVSREWEVAYRIGKNIHRRRFDRLASLDTDELDPPSLGAALECIYPGRSALVLEAMSLSPRNSVPARGRLEWSRRVARLRRAGPALWASMVLRLAHRVARPVGLWVHFTGAAASTAATMTRSFWGEKFSVRHLEQWDSLSLGERLKLSIAIRRPCLVVTWSEGSSTPRRATVVDVGDEAPSWETLRHMVLRRAAARVESGSR